MGDQADLFPSVDLYFSTPPRRRVTEPIAREAFVEDGCRYWLKRAWGAGPCILWIMCNPSNADSTKDDPTMLRVMEFSAAWGYGSCIVINPIPLISSTPAAALEWAKKIDEIKEWFVGDPICDQWNTNIVLANQMIDAAEAHVVAWGNNIPADFVRDWLQALAEACDSGKCGGGYSGLPPIEWLCLGTTSSGAPKHPLARGKHRIPDDFKPVPWKQK